MRRDRKTIKMDVLNVIFNGTHHSTQIMYKSNLSWKTLHEVLDSLLESDLIELTHDYEKRSGVKGFSKRYTLTEKGKEVIDMSFHINAGLGDGKNDSNF